jgi:hypothetical protein
MMMGLQQLMIGEPLGEALLVGCGYMDNAS